jgi:hypothetical protein
MCFLWRESEKGDRKWAVTALDAGFFLIPWFIHGLYATFCETSIVVDSYCVLYCPMTSYSAVGGNCRVFGKTSLRYTSPRLPWEYRNYQNMQRRARAVCTRCHSRKVRCYPLAPSIATNIDQDPLRPRRAAKWQMQPLRAWRPYVPVGLPNYMIPRGI